MRPQPRHSSGRFDRAFREAGSERIQPEACGRDWRPNPTELRPFRRSGLPEGRTPQNSQCGRLRHADPFGAGKIQGACLPDLAAAPIHGDASQAASQACVDRGCVIPERLAQRLALPDIPDHPSTLNDKTALARNAADLRRAIAELATSHDNVFGMQIPFVG